MNKLVLLIFILFSVFILVGCENKVIDEIDVKLEDLGYFIYIYEENFVIIIKVKDFGVIKV